MGPILGAIFAILVGMLAMPSLMSLQSQAMNNINSAQVAQEARVFNEASTKYIQANVITLQTTATSSAPVSVSVAQLQAANFLASTFKASNQFSQSWQLQVLQPTPGNLQGLAITTGGEGLSDTQAMRIAKLIGSNGGFFPKNDTGMYAGGSTNAYGTNWGPVPAAGYTAQPGHLASLLSFSSGQLTDNRLYRNAVPGQPQLNTMTTPLIMNSVQVVNAVCSTLGAIARDVSGSLLVCRGGFWKPGAEAAYWKDPVANLASLPGFPACDAAAAWQTRVVQVPSVGVGPRAFTCNGATWQPLSVDDSGNLLVAGRLTAANETITGTATINALNGNLQVTATATEGAACVGEGRIASSTTSSGEILSCRLGVWKSSLDRLANKSCASGLAVISFDPYGSPVCGATSSAPSGPTYSGCIYPTASHGATYSTGNLAWPKCETQNDYVCNNGAWVLTKSTPSWFCGG